MVRRGVRGRSCSSSALLSLIMFVSTQENKATETREGLQCCAAPGTPGKAYEQVAHSRGRMLTGECKCEIRQKLFVWT